MKNFKLQTFEKNNYFYGKLLTVRDFQIEQKYHNEKRWMINRLMFGNGIATGLNIVMIDDQTITVEPGVAIDNIGREIVVSSPVTQKLSLVDGFDNSGYSKSVYLCIDYEEKGKERIQTITNSIDDESDDTLSYNRIQENYKIYLKENVSSDDLNKNNSSSYSKTNIYENDKIQIFQITPKYLEPNEEFELIIDVIKKEASCKLDFMYTIESENVFPINENGTNSILIDFKEPVEEIKSNYTIKYKLKCDSRIIKNASMHILVDTIKVNEQKISQINDLFIDFSIVEDKIDALLKECNNKPIESIINDESFETIYLAKINILKVGSTYMIKSILNCPFNQYVYSNNILVDMLMSKINKLKNITESCSDNTENRVEDYSQQIENKNSNNSELSNISMAEGEYIFKLDYKMKYPEVLYSKEIIHGLGLGDVMINVSVYEEENFEDVILSGDVDLFDKCQCKIATTLNPKKGTFSIAVKVMNSFRYDQIRVKWFAVKNNK